MPRWGGCQAGAREGPGDLRRAGPPAASLRSVPGTHTMCGSRIQKCWDPWPRPRRLRGGWHLCGPIYMTGVKAPGGWAPEPGDGAGSELYSGRGWSSCPWAPGWRAACGQDPGRLPFSHLVGFGLFSQGCFLFTSDHFGRKGGCWPMSSPCARPGHCKPPENSSPQSGRRGPQKDPGGADDPSAHKPQEPLLAPALSFLGPRQSLGVFRSRTGALVHSLAFQPTDSFQTYLLPPLLRAGRKVMPPCLPTSHELCPCGGTGPRGPEETVPSLPSVSFRAELLTCGRTVALQALGTGRAGDRAESQGVALEGQDVDGWGERGADATWLQGPLSPSPRASPDPLASAFRQAEWWTAAVLSGIKSACASGTEETVATQAHSGRRPRVGHHAMLRREGAAACPAGVSVSGPHRLKVPGWIFVRGENEARGLGP